jgi:hypothetical protein
VNCECDRLLPDTAAKRNGKGTTCKRLTWVHAAVDTAAAADYKPPCRLVVIALVVIVALGVIWHMMG